MDVENKKLPCADKLAFDTYAQASAGAVAVDWQHGAKMTPYKCTHCDLWHLSSRASSD